MISGVSEFRYSQYCPLARAVEVLGERWTLLVIRELVLGPKRFSDLKRALPGVSPSVLSERLARLEERGLVARRELPPPTPASLYELGENGRALIPALFELVRWGARFLGQSHLDDHFEPEWLQLGFAAFARKTATPARTFSLCVQGSEEAGFRVSGGEDGTTIHPGAGPADLSISVASPLVLFALASRQLPPAEAVRSGAVQVEGDAAELSVFPDLFDMDRDDPSPQQQGE
jgi:DNA-binding HxlR family transcriptional regulator